MNKIRPFIEIFILILLSVSIFLLLSTFLRVREIDENVVQIQQSLLQLELVESYYEEVQQN